MNGNAGSDATGKQREFHCQSKPEGGNVEDPEENGGHAFSFHPRRQRSLRNEDWMLSRRYLQLVVEGVVPHPFDVFPIGNNASAERVR